MKLHLTDSNVNPTNSPPPYARLNYLQDISILFSRDLSNQYRHYSDQPSTVGVMTSEAVTSDQPGRSFRVCNNNSALVVPPPPVRHTLSTNRAVLRRRKAAALRTGNKIQLQD